MDLQLVTCLAHSANMPYLPNQFVRLVGKNMTAQRDPSFVRTYGDRTRVGNHATYGRSNPLVQNCVIHILCFESGAKAGCDTYSPVPSVASGRCHAVPDFVTGVDELIAKQRAAPSSAVRVQQVHCSSSKNEASQPLRFAFHTASWSRSKSSALQASNVGPGALSLRVAGHTLVAEEVAGKSRVQACGYDRHKAFRSVDVFPGSGRVRIGVVGHLRIAGHPANDYVFGVAFASLQARVTLR
jgi:hypothetical protein